MKLNFTFNRGPSHRSAALRAWASVKKPSATYLRSRAQRVRRNQ